MSDNFGVGTFELCPDDWVEKDVGALLGAAGRFLRAHGWSIGGKDALGDLGVLVVTDEACRFELDDLEFLKAAVASNTAVLLLSSLDSPVGTLFSRPDWLYSAIASKFSYVRIARWLQAMSQVN